MHNLSLLEDDEIGLDKYELKALKKEKRQAKKDGWYDLSLSKSKIREGIAKERRSTQRKIWAEKKQQKKLKYGK